MIRFFYNLLYPVGLLFFLPGQISKLLRRGNYRHKFGQRFGFYDRAVCARLALRRCTWIHAVSVGEVAIALKLASKLREQAPAFFCVLTTTTTTGFHVATAEAGEEMEVLYSPLDFWPIMRRAFAVIRPSRIVLVEAEYGRTWPRKRAGAAFPWRWSMPASRSDRKRASAGFARSSRRPFVVSMQFASRRPRMWNAGLRLEFRASAFITSVASSMIPRMCG